MATLLAALVLFMALPVPAGKDIAFERPADKERAELVQAVRGDRDARAGIVLAPRGKRVAVVATLGERPTGGYSIEIRKIRLEDSTLVVTADIRKPGPRDFVTQAFTYPADAAWIPARSLPRNLAALKTKLVDQEGAVLSEHAPSREK